MCISYSSPYSRYGDLFDYYRAVGTLCSLLFHNGICDEEGIDHVLSHARLFRSIEDGFNPLLATSTERVWLPLIAGDQGLSTVFSKEANGLLSNIEDAEVDWLSMWAGSTIAYIAITYDITMRTVVEHMPFRRFMEFSVANHGQPEQRTCKIFERESGGRFQPKMFPGELYEPDAVVALRGDAERLVIDCLGLQDAIDALGEECIVAASGHRATNALIACAAALATGDGEPSGAEARDIELDVLTVPADVPVAAALIGDVGAVGAETDMAGKAGVAVPNAMGSWSARIGWLTAGGNADRTRYLQKMMPYIWILKKSWLREHANEAKEIRIPMDVAMRVSISSAEYRNAFMTVPLGTARGK